jgi:hypothetical protein
LVFDGLTAKYFLIFKLRPDKVCFFLILNELKPKSFLDDSLNQVAIISEPNKYPEWRLVLLYVKLPVYVVGVVDYE